MLRPLAGLFVLGLLVACSACSSASDSGGANQSLPPGPYPGEADAGVDGAGGGLASDAGMPDTWVAEAAAPPPTQVVFVHASPSLPSLRLCWSVDMSQPAFPSRNEMPASNYAGLPVGGAIGLDGEYRARLLAGSSFVTLYGLDAKNLAQQNLSVTPCSQLVCAVPLSPPPCLALNRYYWKLADIAPGQLRTGTTNVIALSGCEGLYTDPNASPARCGPTWSDVQGNLHADIFSVGNGDTPDAGPLLVQAAQLSPGIEALEGNGGTALLSFGPQEDASAPVARLGREGELMPPSWPLALTLPPGLPSFGQYGFAVDVTGADAGAAGHLWMSLAQSLQLLSPAQDPSLYYGMGGTYLVALLGDPMAPHAFEPSDAGGYNGTGLHLLVLPMVPTFPADASTAP
jgi:hypothetical protein